MTTLFLQARDYLDGVSLPELDVEVTLVAVAEWKEPVLTDELDGPNTNRPIVTARPRPGRSWETVSKSIPLVPESGITNADGIAKFDWPFTQGSPLGNAFEQLRQQVPPDARNASFFVRFRVQAEIGGRIDSTTLPERAAAESSVQAQLVCDLAESIVGHTTETTARLWFRSNIQNLPAGFRYVCELYENRLILLGQPRNPVFTATVEFDRLWANTAVVTASGLMPGKDYAYHVYLERPNRTRLRLVTGSFTTAESSTTTLSVAFASCHQPLDGRGNVLSRWEELVTPGPGIMFPRRPEHDLVLLMGDQIYGDRVLKPPSSSSETWFDRYALQYQRYWRYRPVREALRRHPVYMMLDDHEVKDDWGITFAADTIGTADDQQRVVAGMRAFAAFQQAHGPRGLAKNTWASTDAVDYSFRRGQVAFYVLDGRTQRGRLAAGSPVLGAAQLNRFRQWARSDAQSADVIVLVAPVPLTVGNTEKITAIIKDPVGPEGGALLGELVENLVPGGGLLKGLGSVVGWVFDKTPAGELVEQGIEELLDSRGVKIQDGEVLEPDLADRWDDRDNRADLAAVLDTLFDLANDHQNGGRRPRAVVVLGGDIHAGAIHRITSTSPRHGRVREIWQFTSSPISHEPTSRIATLRKFGGDSFPLCDSGDGGKYTGHFEAGPLPQRNFGSLLINRPNPAARTYDITGIIRGETEDLRHDLRFDLDIARPVGVGRPPGSV
ncbi:alkaline phosphatase D family protein [Streptomyces purpurascens]|uniref:alkaline phosphatase D family protein n=1 Tax=Streptomyces purpurascens TaxID=1924 RepID=UPI003C3084CA